MSFVAVVLLSRCGSCVSSFFFFNDTATTEIYTLSLHDALPILRPLGRASSPAGERAEELVGSFQGALARWTRRDRKSTRLNSSHLVISYAVFCLKKKKQQTPRADTATYMCTVAASCMDLCDWLA